MNKQTNKKFNLFNGNIFYNDIFVWIFALICAVIIWFLMAANNLLDRPRTISDIPIEIQLTEAAQEQGVRVFYQDKETASVSVSGSTLVINNIDKDNITVVAQLDPSEQKLSGHTLVTETLDVSAQKNTQDFIDYNVESVNPESITVYYDRYKEATFDIQNEIKYSTTSAYYVEAPVLSQSSVMISGPETSVNRIAKVSIVDSIDNDVTQSQSLTSKLVLYDADGKELDLEDLFLTLSVTEIDVAINVLSKQTATLEITTLNLPAEFSESRIVIEPSTIDIAGELDVVSNYAKITLATPIDFSNITPDNNNMEIEIPMPENVIAVSGEKTATVTINLNGFSEKDVLTSNINLINVPEGKEAKLVSQNIFASVVGPTAQINTLTPDSVYGNIDVANYADQTGNIEVAVSVGVSGLTSSWVTGQYSVVISIGDIVDASVPATTPSQ